jgi:hypothetical protein
MTLPLCPINHRSSVFVFFGIHIFRTSRKTMIVFLILKYVLRIHRQNKYLDELKKSLGRFKFVKISSRFITRGFKNKLYEFHQYFDF